MDAFDEIAARFGIERARRLLEINPTAIAEGTDIIREKTVRKSRTGFVWD
jgi:hypothetical protein